MTEGGNLTLLSLSFILLFLPVVWKPEGISWYRKRERGEGGGQVRRRRGCFIFRVSIQRRLRSNKMIGRPAQEIRRHKSKAVLEAASAYSSSCFCLIIISYCCSLLLSHFSVFFIGVELVLLVARKKGRGGGKTWRIRPGTVTLTRRLRSSSHDNHWQQNSHHER